MNPTRPILRYHGGKWILAPWIISNLPPHRVYVEPFGGAASVLLRKPRSYAEVYNDLDGEITSLFSVVRDRPTSLAKSLKWTPFSRDEYRASFEPTEDPQELARRTIIRSHMGFGSNSINRAVKSGFRANSNRSGTTPAHDWVSVPRSVIRVGKRLRGVVIENKPAIELIAQHDGPDTLFYVDPPYVHTTRSVMTTSQAKGYRYEMDDDAHEQLAACLHDVAGMVVLSGYACPLYQRLYAGWETQTKPALADGAKPRMEVLWFNALAGLRLASAAPSLFASEVA